MRIKAPKWIKDFALKFLEDVDFSGVHKDRSVLKLDSIDDKWKPARLDLTRDVDIITILDSDIFIENNTARIAHDLDTNGFVVNVEGTLIFI